MNNDLRYYGNPMNWESTKGDLISREALRKEFEDLFYNDYDDMKRTERLIDNAPTVEPEKAKEGEIVKAYTKGFDDGIEITRQKGEWTPTPDDFAEFKCSVCEKPNFWQDNFCPNCGAKMKGGAE